jgi:hypothetical protein
MVREYAELLPGGKPAAKNPPDFGGTQNILQILLVVSKTSARWQACKGKEKGGPTAGTSVLTGSATRRERRKEEAIF